jgi:hypothetical protein
MTKFRFDRVEVFGFIVVALLFGVLAILWYM